jgi:dethiobiotin synthetase
VSILVVTGTGTGVGKTVVSAAVCALASERGSRVAYLKAAQTGTAQGDDDCAEVRRLAPGVHALSCGSFPDPLSPAAAARRAGLEPVDLDAVAQTARELSLDHDLVVLEGAGGLLVRFDEDGATMADLARELDCDVLIVATAGLGTLNHTALTLEVMAHRGLRLAGVVIGCWPTHPGLAERSNVRDLATLAARPLAGALAEGAATLADFRRGLGPALGGTFDARDFSP